MEAFISFTLREAFDYVMERLPAGITLSREVFVSRYPVRNHWEARGGAFSYDFMSVEGRNVATWIPDMQRPPLIQAGLDGRGRVFGVRPDEVMQVPP